jgi:hypothetical protein
MFTGLVALVFSHRWLVSLTKGKIFENEHAKQSAVKSQLSGLKYYRVAQQAEATFIPPLHLSNTFPLCYK